MQCPNYPPLQIKGKSLLPIVQGGMGVGISAHRLAGNVARLGAVGTIASPDLRRHHRDSDGMVRPRSRQGGHRRGQPDRPGPGDPGGPGDRAGPGDDRGQRHACRFAICRVRPPGLRERCRGHRHGSRPAPRPARSHGRLPRRGADSHPFRCPRDQRRGEKMGSQESLARCNRHRAPILRRRSPGRHPARRSGRAPIRFRDRDPRRARSLRFPRDRPPEYSTHRRGRDQQPRDDSSRFLRSAPVPRRSARRSP